LTAKVDEATKQAFEKHSSYIAEQVLAEGIGFASSPEGAFSASGKVGSDGGAEVQFAIVKR
jgi:hypothetical protein